MRWLKREMWKAGIAIAGMLLLLVLMMWVPVSAVGAQERASGLATPGAVQATPTVDPTMTTLQKEQLTLQNKQLQNQLQNQNNWLVNNSTALIAAFTTLVVALFGIYQWAGNRRDARQREVDAQDKELADRQAERERRDEEQQRWLKDQEAEREKRAEERFQSAVTGLGDEKEGAKIGAAILLRTFLRPDYEQFYTQTFDLAVAHLRLSRESGPRDGDPDTPLLLTTLSQALVVVFKEAFPLARSQNKGSTESLDASRIKLDNAYLVGADLKQVWMPDASLRAVKLDKADLRGATLSRADLSGAKLREADLSGATLKGVVLNGANLYKANLREVSLDDAKLNKATLNGAVFDRADLHEANLCGSFFNRTILCGANLSEANLYGVNLNGSDLRLANLSGANLSGFTPEIARSFRNANLRGVKGLTKEQLAICKAKGAIIDEDTTTSSSQSSVSPSPPSQSNDVQAPSAPPAQVNTPTPDTGVSSATSSQPGAAS